MSESPIVAPPIDDVVHHLESQPDTGEVYVDMAELFDSLLDRVITRLDVDTAAVLLLDASGSRLVATASRGLEEEIRQGVRIPVGHGFAGRVASTKQPVIVDEVDHASVANAVLKDKGVRSMLGVPLVDRGVVIGVLHVGSFAPRRFTSAEAEVLQSLADGVAGAAQSRRLKAENATAVALQHSLVPDALPMIHGLELAGRYVPGEDHTVGGDWYDVFSLEGGRVGITIGDVAGRGLRAAVIMGRLRSALRAYALETIDPAEVITRLDYKLQHFEPGEMATVLYAVFDATLQQLHVSSAGHPAPVIARPDQPAVDVSVDPDLPLGVPMAAIRHSATIDVEPGTVLCFYTDGLVERRHEPLDPRLELLRSVVTADDPERVCASVMLSLIGSARAADDVALLIVRREHQSGPLRLELPARPSSLEMIRAASRRWLSAHGANRDEGDDMLVALGEACANAVEHAYGSREGTVAVELDRELDDIVMTVRDSGRWRAARGLHRGRGMLVMEQFSDRVDVQRDPDGTTVTIRRRVVGQTAP